MDEQSGGENGGPASSENAGALRALAMRLLQERFPDDPDSPDETQLIVGALPEHVRFHSEGVGGKRNGKQ